MLVRVNVGSRAGQLQDIVHWAARLMIADGRASLPPWEAASEKSEDKEDKGAQRQRKKAH